MLFQQREERYGFVKTRLHAKPLPFRFDVASPQALPFGEELYTCPAGQTM